MGSLASPELPASAPADDALESEGAAAAGSLLWGAAHYFPKSQGLNVSMALSSQASEMAEKWASDWTKTSAVPQACLLSGTHLGIITRSREPLRSWITRTVDLRA